MLDILRILNYYSVMISFLKGKIVFKDFGHIIIEVNGVGYFVNITLNTYLNISNESDEILLFTYLHHWEEGMELYGFLNEKEKEVFKRIVSVSGIGYKLANRILQNVEYYTFVKMICDSNILGLVKINGIGRKTAEKLIFELKEKFALSEFSSTGKDAFGNNYIQLAVDALVLNKLFYEYHVINVCQIRCLGLNHMNLCSLQAFWRGARA